MKRTSHFLFIVLLAAGCAQTPPAPTEEAVRVEMLDDGLSKVTLSAHAARRLGIQTVDVRREGARMIIPYAAVIYDPEGAAWTYTESESGSLSFQRASIAVEDIVDDDAILTDGPPVGTRVVIVGAAELYGAEIGVGGGH